jgi:predicted porin
MTFYGRGHLSLDYMDDGTDARVYLSSNSSRLGIKGSEPLSADWQAIWQVESSIKLDESGKELATRNSFVGIKGPYGKLLAGRYSTPFRKLRRRTDLFWSQLGSARCIAGVGGAGWDLRSNNMIVYFAPDWNGLSGTLGARPEEAVPRNNLYSLNFWYENEGLILGAGYEIHGRMMTGLDTDDGELDLPSVNSESGVRLALLYTRCHFIFTSLYEQLFDVAGIAGDDRSTLGAGLACTYGANTVKTQYYWTGGIESLHESGGSILAVAWEISLSSATMVYLAGALTTNESNSSYSITAGSHGDKIDTVPGENPAGISIGLLHKFERKTQ